MARDFERVHVKTVGVPDSVGYGIGHAGTSGLLYLLTIKPFTLKRRILLHRRDDPHRTGTDSRSPPAPDEKKAS